MAEDFTIDRFVDALGQLPEYGGHEALAGGLRDAYPDVTFKPPFGDNDYSGGIQTYDWDPSFSKQGTPSFLGQAFRLDDTALQQSAKPHFLAAYEAMWPTLSGLVNPSTSPALTGSMLSSGSSPASGAITTTSGGIPSGGIFGGTTSNALPPTSTSLTDSMPSQEEVNNIAYKDWVNKTVNVDPAAGGKDIYDLEDKGVGEDVADHNLLAGHSVDELIATATSERTPYTSQVPNSANKYLQGGPNAFAYSGEGGYAAERQRMLGRAPDIYQGPEVPWQRLGKDAPSDVYYGNQRFNAPTGEVADVGGGEEFDWNAWRNKMRAGTIAERFEIDTDNTFDNIKDNYGDLADDRLADIMEDVKEYWPSLAGTGVDLSNIKTTEDLYNNPIVQKNVSEGFGKIKDIFTKTGEGIKKGAGILKGVVDELTRITERKGGRGSVTEGDPFGVSATGLAEGLLGILTLDFDGKKLDRQEYGNLQPAALIAASQIPGLLPVQIANELKDFVKDAINVSTFADPEYKAGGSFADARHNATEFAGSILRPFVQTIAKVIGGKTTDASLKDLLKKSDLENIKTGEPWRTDFKGYELFPEKVEDTPADSEVDPSIGEIDTSALVDEVLKETVTETGSTPDANFGGKGQPTQPPVTAPIVDVTIPEEQETASPHLGQGVSAGPSAATGSTLSAGPVTGEVKSVTIDDTPPPPPPETDSLGDQGVDITDGGGTPGNISTLDLIEMINPADDSGPTRHGPDGQQFISEEEVQDYLNSLKESTLTKEPNGETIDDPPPNLDILANPQPVDADGNPITPPTLKYTDITYPVGKDGNPYIGDDISEIARWKTTPVSSTDVNKIKEIFGNDVGEAYAKYGEGSKDNDSWKGQGNKPLDLRNADLQKQKEEWTTQKQEGLNKEFIDNATSNYVDAFLGYNSSDKGGITEEEWLKLPVQGGGSFKGSTMSDYLTYRKGIQSKTLSDIWKKEQEKDSNAGLAITTYKALAKGSGGIDPTKANKQKLKELFSNTMKDFAKQNVLLNFEADSIEEALDVDYIKMLDNMGIELSGLRNVGGEGSSEGRANAYLEPLEKAIDEQFTADTLENKLLSNLIDANDFLNSPPEHQQALIDQYKEEGNAEAAKALEQLLTKDEPDIDKASEFFAENASDKVLKEWLGFRDDYDYLIDKFDISEGKIIIGPMTDPDD